MWYTLARASVVKWRMFTSALCLLLLIGPLATGQKTSTETPTSSTIPELNTILMETTFRIQGPKKAQPDSIAYGTCFFVGKPVPSDPKRAYYVLVTAAHVLDDIEGDIAIVLVRKPRPEGGYTGLPYPLQIRSNGKDIFTRHKTADVAVMYATMPRDLDITLLDLSFFGDDAMLKRFEIHPGDELTTLGFPLYVSSEFGFPILRSGKVASYPILPTKVYGNILFDFNVFPGNSGGPVYFVSSNRFYENTTHLGQIIQFVVGLVTAQVGSLAHNNQMINLGSVVPASFIRETLDMLPPDSPYK